MAPDALAAHEPAAAERPRDGSPGSPPRAGALLARPWAIALAVSFPLTAVYLAVQPPSGDLAAATYRSDLFARVGFTLWDNGWYGGHYLPGYSLLAPALGALVGNRVLLALCTVAAAWLFGLIAQRTFSAGGARLAAGSFALGASVTMLSGRVAFSLGLAVGLLAVVALQRGRTSVALALGALTSLASPVAGAFLALAGWRVRWRRWGRWVFSSARTQVRAGGGDGCLDAAAVARPGPRRYGACPDPAAHTRLPRRRLGAVRAVGLLARPGGGAALMCGVMSPAAARGSAARPLPARRARAHLGGVALCAGARRRLRAAHPRGLQRRASGRPVRGAARGGRAVGAPPAAEEVDPTRPGSWLRHPLVLLALAAALLYWQLETPLNDVSELVGDPSVNASYYAPLLGELQERSGGAPLRVEVPMMGTHWESVYLPTHGSLLLARGWERQLDTRYAALFYESAGPPGAAGAHPDHVPGVAVRKRGLLRGAARRAPGLRGRRGGAADRARAALPARSVALGALAPLRRAGCAPTGNPPGDPHRRRCGLLHAHRPTRGQLHGARALHALLGARRGARVRAQRSGRLDRGRRPMPAG